VTDGVPRGRRPGAEEWDAALFQLRQLREAGQLTTAKVRQVAEALGVSERSVWRRLARPAAPPRGFRLSETDRAAYVDFRGNIAAVHRARAAAIAGETTVAGVPIGEDLLAGWAGAAPVTERTLQRAFAAELTPAARAAAASGERARRAKLVYLRRRATFRNQVWEGDHKNLPILVLPPRGAACTPWVTSFVDDATRTITGWAISTTPHAGTVLTALRMGILPNEAGPACGVPGMLRLDRGLEFAADAVTAAAGVLGVEVNLLPPYQPHGKGKIERVNRTVDQIFLSMLPGFTEGPRRLNGRLSGPLDDRQSARVRYGEAAEEPGADPATLPMRWDTLVARFGTWVAWYNTQRKHSRLRGRTPAEAWAEDPTPLHEVPEEVLRHLLLAEATRTVNGDGIYFRNLIYADPTGALRERRGTKVQIRYMPHDDRFIHVYLNGAYLTTCHPDNALSDEQTEQFYAAARAQARAAAAEARAATRRARRRLAVLAADTGTDAVSVRRISAGEAARYQPHPGSDDLRRDASTSLLGLHPAAPLPDPIPLEEDTAPW